MHLNETEPAPARAAVRQHEPPLRLLVRLPSYTPPRARQNVLHDADRVLLPPAARHQRRGTEEGPRPDDDPPHHQLRAHHR